MEMKKSDFNAYVVEEKDGEYTGAVTTRSIDQLPEGDLLVEVQYSSLNYKDALSASGNRGVTKNYPHTPGIDAAGIVVESGSDTFEKNDPVIVTSYDLGMNTDGGFGQYIRVPSKWAVKLPAGLTLKESMIMGTAGLTAGMSVLRLSELVKPEDGKIVVSGATGGVGSMSVAILSRLGYHVVAVTGKTEEEEYLRGLGAGEILPRKDIDSEESSPMLKEEFAGGIDTVGGHILENIIKSVCPMGAVTCCGLVASPKLNLTVFPFILRGVTLMGIDSQNYPMPYRQEVWEKLSGEWKPEQLMKMFSEISLDDLGKAIDEMLKGKSRGRTVVKLQ